MKNKNNIIVSQTDSDLIPSEGKTLYIAPNSPEFNYKSILGQVLQYVNMADVIEKIETGTQYVVQIPVELEKLYESGEYFIMQNAKTGQMWPSLMKIADNGRNQVVTPLPIVKQDVIQGNPVQDLSINYHNMLMQQQMTQLVNMVEDTFIAVKRIEHGQMDDRIGLLEAGKNGMVLALSMPQGQERTMQINSSRQNLLVAQSQIGETLKRRVSEFSPVSKTNFGQFIRELGHSGYLAAKDQEINEMQEYYDLYLQSTKLLAASYAICGDTKTAEETFKIGEHFMQNIDFRNVKSIGYAHPNTEDMFFNRAIEYVAIEKNLCLEEAKTYDYVAVEITGEKLLEVLTNGKSEAISEEKTEQ